MKTIRVLLVTALVVGGVLGAFWLWLTFPAMPGAHARTGMPAPTNVIWLDTGLTPEDQVLWHHLSEGSEAMPMSILETFKSPKTGRPFLHSLADYGFMLESEDPHKLPIGWTVQLRDLGGRDLPFIGINCAGCHTGELRYQGRTVRIDGAPNLYQLEAFFLDLDSAITQALTNRFEALLTLRHVIRISHAGWREQDFLNLSPESIARLDAADQLDTFGSQAAVEPVGAVGAPHKDPVHRKSTHQDMFDQLLASFTREGSYIDRRLHVLHTMNAAIDSGVDLGPGRGDSFGIIRRLLWSFDKIPLDAPVSTPHLFNFGQFEWLHWDGNTKSVMQRNMAQAIALGADFEAATFKTAALPLNLHRLEKVGRKLKPPAWPEQVFGKIDRIRANRGKPLFEQNCLKCHDKEGLFDVAAIGTSPIRARNFGQAIARKEFPDALGAMAAFVETAAFKDHNLTPEQIREMEVEDPVWRKTGQYIARSLAGVWASPPYLHNGSVPTIYDLLQPASRRPPRFPLGHHNYDPQKLGFTTDVPEPLFLFDALIEGNRNTGHEFGTDLPEEGKWDLIEYMKTL